MWKRSLPVLVLLALVVAAPLLLRRDSEVAEAGEGDDHVVILTPQNDSIRGEFGEAFAEHWEQKTGRSIHVDWRAPGGGSEIRKLINGAFAAAEDLGKEGTEFDVFFGGGAPDFIRQAKTGHLAPLEVFETEAEWFSEDCIPESFTGEPYYDRERRWVGVCVSQFGMLYNNDSLERIHARPPTQWSDLGDPVYYGKLALVDPTKSGSVTRLFELLIQEQMQAVIAEEGDTTEARSRGWKQGLNLLQRMAANARYFTDSASKIPHDVAMGDAAVGTCIDFYGRTYEEAVRQHDGTSRLKWVAPEGGTSVSVDPVAVFRGAPNMEIAQEFARFCLSERGQLLWNLKPGVEGGPRDRALRRLPVRRDLYTPDRLKGFTDPDALPFERAGGFVYQRELTGPAFNALRVIFRAMCMDPHDELKEAWLHCVEHEEKLALLEDIEVVSYERVMNELVPMLERKDALETARAMTDISRHFRSQYQRIAKGKGGQP